MKTYFKKVANVFFLFPTAIALIASAMLQSLLPPTSLAESQPICAAISKDVRVVSATASAGTWANLRNNEGSLRYETSRLLGDALAKAPTAAAPQGVCPQACKSEGPPKVIFLATPRKTLNDYSDKAECSKLLEQTTIKPFDFSNRKFPNSADLAAWFNDFSQGSGDDGKDLYNRCYGDCSPRYTTNIRLDSNNLMTDTQVICGHARDKSDDTYILEIKYRWVCEDRLIAND